MLSELAKELESAGKTKNYCVIKEKNSVLSELYEKTVEVITEHRGVNAGETEEVPQSDLSALVDINIDELNKYTETIIAACNCFDSDTILETTEKLFSYSYNNLVLKDVFAEVISLAEDYEYEAAAEAVKAIMQRIVG